MENKEIFVPLIVHVPAFLTKDPTFSSFTGTCKFCGQPCSYLKLTSLRI